ncbi:hypothetical protein EJ02DRAFT_170546 [Clathrospora elynae]|uniref:Uncharacterized protein n=1 Tax=Clathrospora elynae TaxID=706981 RepID=A0A6A5T485_9PLEO|nr:hypothetical protein EJ02DRAFT_170546 [Clathrospora elynae]
MKNGVLEEQPHDMNRELEFVQHKLDLSDKEGDLLSKAVNLNVGLTAEDKALLQHHLREMTRREPGVETERSEYGRANHPAPAAQLDHLRKGQLGDLEGGTLVEVLQERILGQVGTKGRDIDERDRCSLQGAESRGGPDPRTGRTKGRRYRSGCIALRLRWLTEGRRYEFAPCRKPG